MSTNMNLFFYEKQQVWIKDHVDQKHENHESFFPEDDGFFLATLQEIMLNNITIMALFTFTYYYIYIFISVYNKYIGKCFYDVWNQV